MRTEIEKLALAPPAEYPGVGQSGDTAADFDGPSTCTERARFNA